jgi:D-tyrosyl-tRNA(Tyr) deacylase
LKNSVLTDESLAGMKAVIQRVTQASVAIEGTTIASIQSGLCVLLGISRDDTAEDADYM